MPAPTWHWIGFGDITKQIEVRFGAISEPDEETGDFEWGNRYYYDQTPPNEVANFDGQFLTLSQVMALRALALTPLGRTSVTTVLGQTWTGYIVSLKPTYIRGTPYYSCQLGLLNCVVT